MSDESAKNDLSIEETIRGLNVRRFLQQQIHAKGVKNLVDVDEIIHEIQIAFLKQEKDIQFPYPWICAVGRRKIIDKARKLIPQEQSQVSIESVELEAGDQCNLINSDLVEKVFSLCDACEMVIVKCVMLGKTDLELANELELVGKTADSKRTRAGELRRVLLKRLRNELEWRDD